MWDLPSLLELSAIILSLGFIAYASWKDWGLREVDDKVWLAFGPAGASLTFLRLVLTGSPTFFRWGLSVAVSVGLGLTLFSLGFWGGADAKALVCLALTLPVYPSLFNPILGFHFTVFPLTVLFNTYILSITAVVYVSLRNLAYRLGGGRLFEGFEGEFLPRKILAFLVTYKVERERLLENPSLSLAEEFSPAGRKWKFRVGIGGEERTRLGSLPAEVWVTPQLPLLVFLTAGLLVGLFLGDLALALIAGLFSLLTV